MKFSIRTRLTLLITLVYVSVFFLLLASAAIAVYLGVKTDIDDKLETERNGMTGLFESRFRNLSASTLYQRTHLTDEFLAEINKIQGYRKQFVVFSLETENNQRIYSGGGIKNLQLLLPKDFLNKKEGFYHQRLDGILYRILVAKPDWGTLVVGIENQTFFEIARQFRDILLIGVPLTLILVLAGGRFLAGRAMKPVVSAAQSAEKITLTNLNARLPKYTGKDEFGELVATLNQMITRIEEGLHQVQQFTQDAAHELRTPLTILRGELELAYQQPDLPDDLRPSLQKALDRAISMSQIAENLMLLANSDTGNYPIQKNTVQMHDLAVELADDVRCLVNGHSIEVRLTRCESATICGDRRLIQRLLLNLSDNAVKYTEQGYIEFSLATKHNTA